jgi:antitoxin (DNA-binding transcriptional repressor) of toxin-antitoxin stability system
LVERAAAGEEIIISKAGKPMARLVPYTPAQADRALGALRGQIHIAPDFDADDDDLVRLFEGEG